MTPNYPPEFIRMKARDLTVRVPEIRVDIARLRLRLEQPLSLREERDVTTHLTKLEKNYELMVDFMYIHFVYLEDSSDENLQRCREFIADHTHIFIAPLWRSLPNDPRPAPRRKGGPIAH